MKRKELYIILLNYNEAKGTISLANSILKQEKVDIGIMIVDNCSPDNSFDILYDYFKDNKEVDIIKNVYNGGYAHGNNAGLNAILQQNPKYVAVLNTDIIIKDELLFSKLIGVYEKLLDAAFISPVLRDTKNEIDQSCIWKSPTFLQDLLSSFWIYRKFNKQEKNPLVLTSGLGVLPVDIFAGSFFLTSYKYFKELGFFDTKTFLYLEERILHDKVKKTKRQNYVVSNLSYEHLKSKSINKEFGKVKQYRIYNESLLYYTRTYRRFGYIKTVILFPFLKYKIAEVYVINFWQGITNKLTRNHGKKKHNEIKRIVFIHLLNDLSGSPLVLSNVIKICKEKGFDVTLYSAKGEGFLSNLTDKHHTYPYRHFNNRIMTLFSLMFSQIILFFMLLRHYNQDAIFYINTMLPFGGALAGKLIGRKVVYHTHETSVSPVFFKSFLRLIIKFTCNQNIFVSNYLKKKEAMIGIKNYCIHNCLSKTFTEISSKIQPRLNERFNVLMICSLKEYKGIKAFLKIANILEKDNIFNFILVLNTSKNRIDRYFINKNIPKNLEILIGIKDTTKIYKSANILLNLSYPDKLIETFGMTILEAMAFGIPCIVPPVGGPRELIEDGKEGYLITSYSTKKIAERIRYLFKHSEIYQSLSQNAKTKSRKFSYYMFEKKIMRVIDE